MQSKATTPKQYISELPEDRALIIKKLRDIILAQLPDGFQECMSYGMIGYVVPHSIYPDGYHCTPELPLPFMNIASQKNHIAVYHAGIYADENLYNWFTEAYKKTDIAVKLNMGKSCIRFKKEAHIPYELIGELAAKLTPKKWIELYESAVMPTK